MILFAVSSGPSDTSNTVALALIALMSTTLTAVIAMIPLLIKLWLDQKELKKSVNGHITNLLAAVERGSHAEGKAEGKAEEKIEGTARQDVILDAIEAVAVKVVDVTAEKVLIEERRASELNKVEIVAEKVDRTVDKVSEKLGIDQETPAKKED